MMPASLVHVWFSVRSATGQVWRRKSLERAVQRLGNESVRGRHVPRRGVNLPKKSLGFSDRLRIDFLVAYPVANRRKQWRRRKYGVCSVTATTAPTRDSSASWRVSRSDDGEFEGPSAANGSRGQGAWIRDRDGCEMPHPVCRQGSTQLLLRVQCLTPTRVPTSSLVEGVGSDNG